MTLERAQAALRRMDLDTDMVLFGLPLSDFTKEDLIFAVALAQQDLATERRMHSGTMGMMRAAVGAR